METITPYQKSTEVYHRIMSCAEIFSRLSCNIPKQLVEVVQHIHGSLDNSAHAVSVASNSFDNQEKQRYLNYAQREVFFLYNRIEYLVKAHGISIGQANEFILELRKCHEHLGRWINSSKKVKAL